MEYRPLEITVISANDLKDVGRFSKMDVYVVVSLSDEPCSTCRTPIHKDGGKSPKWNHKVKLFVNENYLSRNPKLIFNIRADRTFSDKDVGEVSIPLKDLLHSSDSISAERSVEYKVRTPKGKSEGKLKFSYKFGEKSKQPVNSTKNSEPVTAYPPFAGPSKDQSSYAQPPPAATAYQAPPPATAYQAPPAATAYQAPPAATTGYGYPPQGYGGYPPPPPRGYGGYPPAAYGGYPPPAGYGGYPPPVGYGGYMSQQPPPMQAPQKKKKNNFGLGMGAGLLGGLLVGDMISDAGDNMAAYDAGYDDGFDDSAFGF
ncbi:protein SRC2-like [Impatiens glandulifera]|uniref:protein SRC2-like n=1 Tax=Impatiens glandulifera TaxID=253017 RepID=UPI001FB0F0C6|nr:protein SRC2-like [Impatiens glandulifera]